MWVQGPGSHNGELPQLTSASRGPLQMHVLRTRTRAHAGRRETARAPRPPLHFTHSFRTQRGLRAFCPTGQGSLAPRLSRQLREAQTGNLGPSGRTSRLWGPIWVSSSAPLESRLAVPQADSGRGLGPAPRLSCAPARGGGHRWGSADRGGGRGGRRPLPPRPPLPGSLRVTSPIAPVVGRSPTPL